MRPFDIEIPESLQGVENCEKICQTLAVMLRKRDEETKSAFREKLKCISDQSWTRRFCENVLQ